MFKQILVPLDLTDKHQPAIDIAAELARQGKGVVTLLHVVEVIAGLPVEEEKTFYSRLERTAQAHLDRFGKQLTERQVSWQAKVLFGHRAQEIVRHAADVEADVIVLTAPQFDPSNPAGGWGSVSYKAGLLCRCPVLLVK